MKKVLIRADDLGFSKAVNLGIAETVRNGLVRSVGIMTNMPEAENGVNMLKGCDVCYGQHTNICAGTPLCDPALIPTLMGENGEFKTSAEYRAAFKEGKEVVDLDEVILEIEAQYERFVQLTGDKPHYFEGHAVASANFNKGLEIVARRHNVDYLPLAFEPIVFKNSTIRIHLDSMPADYDPYASLRKLILDKDENIVDVFVGHPGYLDAYILKHSSLTVNRALEVDMLTDRAFMRWISEQDVELVTYDDL